MVAADHLNQPQHWQVAEEFRVVLVLWIEGARGKLGEGGGG